MSAEHTYKFGVSMSCGGCSGAVNRVLGKLEGLCITNLHLMSTSHSAPLEVAPSTTTLACYIDFTPCQTNQTMLTSNAGVKSYEVSLDTQTATVITEPSLEYEQVLKTIQKTGKKVNTGEADGQQKSVELIAE